MTVMKIMAFVPTHVEITLVLVMVDTLEMVSTALVSMVLTSRSLLPFSSLDHLQISMSVRLIQMTVKAEMLNVTTPLEALSVTAEMAIDTMEHTVKVHNYAMLCMNVIADHLLSTDIDECAEGSHNCHMMSNASCFDTDGSFYCNCTQGFQGNGTFCDGTL